MNQELKELIELAIKIIFAGNTACEVEGDVWYEEDIDINIGQNHIGNLHIKYMYAIKTTAQEGDTYHGVTETWEECEVTEVVIDELTLTNEEGNNIALTFDMIKLQNNARRWANGLIK